MQSKRVKTKYTKHFDGMCWPDPLSADLDELNWRLRYSQSSITESEMLVLASIISAYQDLIVNKTIQQRHHIIKQLRKSDYEER